MNGFREFGAAAEGSLGYLVGASNLDILGTARRGDTLRIQVVKSVQFGDFRVVEGQVFLGTEVLARGQVKVWHGKKVPA